MNQLANVILQTIDESKKSIGTNILKASVKSPPPKLTIEFSGIIIPSEQIYCSNYLLPHYHRDFTIDGVIDNIEIAMSMYRSEGENGNTTETAVADGHKHSIPSIAGSGNFQGTGTYKSHKDIWFEDTLKVGDEVLVVVMGIYYVVVSKITKMPSGAIEGV